MSIEIYIVKAGDSLTRIARQYGTTPHALAKANDITNINVIRVGQALRVPHTSAGNTPDTTPMETDGDTGSLWVQFKDAISQPIAGLKTWVHVGSNTQEHVSKEDGFLPAIPIERADVPVHIEVAKATGGRKQIAQWFSTLGSTHLLLTSPKIAVSSSMRPHDGPPKPAAKPKPQNPGTKVETRSTAGHPVQQVCMECPNPQNLKLLTNFKYRDIVIAAAQRSGFTPQAVAAIMRAEAATLSTVTYMPVVDAMGNPVIDKKTGLPKTRKLVKNTGEWDPRSASPRSSARGMTQFLDGSWIDEALTNGTYLNAYVKQQGWLTTSTIHWTTTRKDKKGHAEHHDHERIVQAFVLTQGTVTASRARSLARVLSSRPYLTGPATASDANLQALLDLRYEPEFAIHTAVDYGVKNLAALSKAGYKVDSLDAADKAKIIYLCHHLGIGDTEKFIDNTMTEARAKHLFKAQVGLSKTNEAASHNNGSYVTAHREWLKTFIDGRIDVREVMCTPVSTEPTGLLKLTDSIKR